jgi:N-acetyl-alpha-D-muramate 1-phosphate uridylyltransferase
MLLAAGLGTRMRPLTDTLPKPLIPVAGQPLIDRVVQNAIAEGIKRFTINVHYLPDLLASHIDVLSKAHPQAAFFASDERQELLDTGGGIKKALGTLQTDPVLVMNTDAFWPMGSDAPLARMVAAYIENKADIVLLCAQPFRASGFRRSHDFCLSPKGEITNDYGAPVIYAGVALIARALIASVEQERFSLTRLFDAAQQKGALFGTMLNAPWFHVGDPQGLSEAEKALGA